MAPTAAVSPSNLTPEGRSRSRINDWAAMMSGRWARYNQEEESAFRHRMVE
jgi:hypothetical protein